MREVRLFQPISRYFKWHEALWLPSWNRPGTEKDGLSDATLDRLIHLFYLADEVRDFFNAALIVHVAWRSPEYNKFVGGAKDSCHMASRLNEAAVDFHVQGIPCSKAKQRILDEKKLELWGMRMENNGDEAIWIHLDTRIPEVGHSRYFKP